MKIVCDSCGAKYSIADEKVRGKVFKIRCKKCSDVIVVKGQSDEDGATVEEQNEDPSLDSGYGGSSGVSEWYAVIDGDQVGPITTRSKRTSKTGRWTSSRTSGERASRTGNS
ncbi:MAG: zinc-ribbon domain-containing protein [Bradymonadaceae bacterium]